MDRSQADWYTRAFIFYSATHTYGAPGVDMQLAQMVSEGLKTDERGALYGAKEIAAYLGIARGTLGRWRKWHGLPIANAPCGSLMTTRSLLDSWVLTRCDSPRKEDHASDATQT